MRIAVYTLTRDRISYTRHCFDALAIRAGWPYDHFVIDNGSTDGTVQWLAEEKTRFKGVFLNPRNYGNCVGNNQAVSMIGPGRYDLIVRMDNDCEVRTNGALAAVARLYEHLRPAGQFEKFIVSPRVTGIVHQPARGAEIRAGGCRLGVVKNVGGLFRVIPAPVLARYHWPEDMSIVAGEECVAAWHIAQGGLVCYMEDVEVRHFETTGGQEARYPEYHRRKLAEWHDRPAMDYVLPPPPDEVA